MPEVLNLSKQDELEMLRAKVKRLEEAEVLQRQAATLLAGQNRILEMIATGSTLSQILTELVKMIEAQSNGMLCSILLLDQKNNRVLRHGAAPSLPAAFIEAIDGVVIGPAVGSCGTCAYTGEPVIVTNVTTSPLWENYRDLAEAHNLRACWSAPIFSTTRKILGTFAIYYHEVKSPSPADQHLIELTTHTAGIAIERYHDETLLRESEARYKLLSEIVPQMVWRTDAQGKIEYVNERWREYTGCAFEQDYIADWISVIHPEDFERSSTRWQESVKSGQLYEVEYRVRSIDGVYHWFLARALPFKNEQGQITAWFGTCTDIDDQKELDNLRNLLVSVVSHELRTPLTLISAYAQSLRLNLLKSGDNEATSLSQKKGTDKQLAKLEAILKQSEHMDELVRQLLDFSQLQNRRLELKYEPLNLVELARRVVEQQNLTLTSHNLRVEAAQATLIGSWDGTRLEQVLHNLINNALKYSAAGTEVIVGIKESVQPNEVIIWVQDKGYGISPAHQAHIFDSFYRVRNSQNRQADGLGLGLYICHEIVVQHNGRIWLESKPGVGTTFYVALPLSQLV